MAEDTTTIMISKVARDKIKELGNKGETYTDIINRLYKELKIKESIDALMDTRGYMTISQARAWVKKQNKLES